MSFRFRFDALLQLRRRERDEAGAAVGQADAAIRRIELQIEEINQQRQVIRQQSRDARSGTLSVDGLLSQGRFDMQLESEVLSLNQTLLTLEEELGRRQQLLVLTESEVKRYERLEENDRASYQAEQLRREQFEADDATARRYTLLRRRGTDEIQTL